MALGVVLAASGCASFRHPGDAWLGRDKALHFAASAVIGTGVAWAAREAGSGSGEATGVALAVVIPIGSGKEVYDREVKGTYFSGKDLVWDAAGGVTGALLANGIY